MSERQPKWNDPQFPPDPKTINQAAFELMASIDQKGGNPRWPHGGDAVSNSLWHLAFRLCGMKNNG